MINWLGKGIRETGKPREDGKVSNICGSGSGRGQVFGLEFFKYIFL